MAAERCNGATAAMLLAAALVPSVHAAAPPPARQPVQMSLLEFLGQSDPTGRSSRAEGAQWLSFLSDLNLPPPAPVSAPAKAPAGSAPAKQKGHG
ncbi:MAG: hypothetical protein ACYCT1_00900 [Steroidobacteraceae bacterium]